MLFIFFIFNKFFNLLHNYYKLIKNFNYFFFNKILIFIYVGIINYSSNNWKNKL